MYTSFNLDIVNMASDDFFVVQYSYLTSEICCYICHEFTACIGIWFHIGQLTCHLGFCFTKPFTTEIDTIFSRKFQMKYRYYYLFLFSFGNSLNVT